MSAYEPKKPLAAARKRLQGGKVPKHLVEQIAARQVRAERRRMKVVSGAKQGISHTEIAEIVGVNRRTVTSDLAKPKSQAELQAHRDEFRSLMLQEVSRGLAQDAVDLAKNAAREKDPKGFELATRSAVNLDKLTASAVGERQSIDVTGHVNVDVRALLAQAFGYGPHVSSSGV